jgi:hypothetical protein
MIVPSPQNKLEFAIKDHDMGSNEKYPKAVYEIQVQGELDQSWQAYFNGFFIEFANTGESSTTTLIAPVVDQPALRGLLCKLWDLNLTLISVRQLEINRGKERN